MSEKDKEGLVVLMRGVALGFGFVWLLGFAVGYQNGFVPFWLAGMSVGCLWIAKKIGEMD
jgi:hypothetical protein